MPESARFETARILQTLPSPPPPPHTPRGWRDDVTGRGGGMRSTTITGRFTVELVSTLRTTRIMGGEH
eukprot:554459-Pleurochrysis_carterae.AAC.4